MVSGKCHMVPLIQPLESLIPPDVHCVWQYLFFVLTLSQTTDFRLFQLKEFANNNFRFDENSGGFYKRVENTVGKGEIARYEQFLLSPVFSKDMYCRHVKTRAC